MCEQKIKDNISKKRKLSKMLLFFLTRAGVCYWINYKWEHHILHNCKISTSISRDIKNFFFYDQSFLKEERLAFGNKEIILIWRFITLKVYKACFNHSINIIHWAWPEIPRSIWFYGDTAISNKSCTVQCESGFLS